MDIQKLREEMQDFLVSLEKGCGESFPEEGVYTTQNAGVARDQVSACLVGAAVLGQPGVSVKDGSLVDALHPKGIDVSIFLEKHWPTLFHNMSHDDENMERNSFGISVWRRLTGTNDEEWRGHHDDRRLEVARKILGEILEEATQDA